MFTERCMIRSVSMLTLQRVSSYVYGNIFKKCHVKFFKFTLKAFILKAPKVHEKSFQKNVFKSFKIYIICSRFPLFNFSFVCSFKSRKQTNKHKVSVDEQNHLKLDR